MFSLIIFEELYALQGAKVQKNRKVVTYEFDGNYLKWLNHQCLFNYLNRCISINKK